MTVTRTAGSSGRVLVDYTTVDGDNLPSAYSISPYDAPAHGGGNTTTEITVNVDTNGVPIAASSFIYQYSCNKQWKLCAGQRHARF